MIMGLNKRVQIYISSWASPKEVDRHLQQACLFLLKSLKNKEQHWCRLLLNCNCLKKHSPVCVAYVLSISGRRCFTWVWGLHVFWVILLCEFIKFEFSREGLDPQVMHDNSTQCIIFFLKHTLARFLKFKFIDRKCLNTTIDFLHIENKVSLRHMYNYLCFN